MMASSFNELAQKALAGQAQQITTSALTSFQDNVKFSTGNALTDSLMQSEFNKKTNAVAESIRSSKSNSSEITPSAIVESSVAPSASSIAQPPSTKQSTTAILDSSNSPFNVGPYRQSRDPSKSPSRMLDESDDKIATISVKSNKSQTNNIVNSYGNFFLQAVSEAEQEKYQIVETFTAFYTFFYGKRPPVYTFSGLLLNDPKQNWMNTFKHMYENYFRGTATADLNAEAVITYDKRIVTGYLLNLSINQDAISDKGVPFSFSVLVIKHDFMDFSTDFTDFLKNEQEKLRLLREKAALEIKALNTNPDGLKDVLKQQVLNGEKIPVSTKKKDEEEKTQVVSLKQQVENATAASIAAASPVPSSDIINKTTNKLTPLE